VEQGIHSAFQHFGAHEESKGQSGRKSMRAAIVGSGGIAQIHANLIRQIGGSVVAVCSRTLSGAQSLGLGSAYDNLAAMLRAERPDVVHVCSPNCFHKEHTIAALEAGAHVFCEKPLATTQDEAARMVEAAERASRIGAVGYCYRGYSAIQELRLAAASRRFGDLRRVCGEYLSQDVFDPAKYVWHFTSGMSGPAYALLDYGVHWFDLVEHVTGGQFVELSAQFATHQRHRVWRGLPGEGPRPPHGKQLADGSVEVDVALEDHADLLFRLSSGACGSFTVFPASPGNPNHIVLSIDGSKGGFDWCQETADCYVDRSRGDKALRHRDPARLPAVAVGFVSAPMGHPEGYLDAFRSIVDAAWRAMKGEASSYPNFMSGLRGNATVDAAIKSARSRQPFQIKT
jgi:predicted dehydrogenase